MRVVPVLVMALCLVSSCTIAEPGEETFPTALPGSPTVALAPEEMPTAVPFRTVPAPSGASSNAPSQPSAAGDAVAVVNGTPIPRAAFEAQLAQALTYRAGQGALTAEAQAATSTTDPLARHVLNWLIDRALIAQAAEEMRVSVTERDLDTAFSNVRGADAVRFGQWLAANGLTEASFREQLRDDLLMAAVRNRVTANLAPEAEQVRAAHILIGDEATATRLVGELRAGADFGATAREHSEDEGTRSRGGNLGFFPRGVMPPSFDEAAFSLSVGQISDAVRSDLGFHIIQVLERAASRPIAPELWPAVQQRAFEDWLTQQRAHAVIERSIAP
jgi:parvulin-like peptidyl-prolyl isomerase